MIRQVSPKQSGFSLVELMISVVILAIAMAVAMPNYSIWIQNSHIRNAAESIQQGMQRARAEAVARNTNISFTLGSGALWTIRQVSDNSIIEQRPSNEVSSQVTFLVSPVAVSPALPPTTITFGNLGDVQANADATLTITQIDFDSSALAAADSRELRLTIGVGGSVRMCDPNPAVAITDPRHC